jgi:ribosomal protein S18 acetylase RimI-like enzyme
MDDHLIRYATKSDIPELPPLLAELGYPRTLEDLKARFIRFLNNPGYGIAVCEIDNEIVGLVAWSKSDLFVSDKVRFHIEGLIVAENHRGMSIGKKLMEFVEEIAKQHAPAIIDLTSGIRRAKDGSHEFYKRLGYQNEGLMAKLYLRKEL